MMKLTDKQQEFLNSRGHSLVIGGPGSGKTTISIIKASRLVEDDLISQQKVLFLSFARASVSRVIEAIEHYQGVSKEVKKNIEVDTYHSFFWRILKTHGYLIGLPRKISILTPPDEAIALSIIRNKYDKKLTPILKKQKKDEVDAELKRLAYEEGKICFDFFAYYLSDILKKSNRICELVSKKFPIIIVDEFQDTNAGQWEILKALGKCSRLIALADPEQRIYDWIGADPERLNNFREAFNPTEISLGRVNHRSTGTDILEFGDSILNGSLEKKAYRGVNVEFFEAEKNQAYTKLITIVFAAFKRLEEKKINNWTIAILVPTKKLMRLVSDNLSNPPGKLKRLPHTASIDIEGAILSAEVIAYLMQPNIDGQHFEKFIGLVCQYHMGRGGESPTKGDLQEAVNIKNAYNDYTKRKKEGKSLKKRSILNNIITTYNEACSIKYTGDPNKDWMTVRHVLEKGCCKRLNGLAVESRNIRILGSGTQLRQDLSNDWRENSGYKNSLDIIKQTFVKQHFSSETKPERGIVVMNMHKAKGKQFDEVIIFEGWPNIYKGVIQYNGDRIIKNNSCDSDNEQSRQNLRVSVTRAKSHVTILTPKIDPCIALK